MYWSGGCERGGGVEGARRTGTYYVVVVMTIGEEEEEDGWWFVSKTGTTQTLTHEGGFRRSLDVAVVLYGEEGKRVVVCRVRGGRGGGGAPTPGFVLGGLGAVAWSLERC